MQNRAMLLALAGLWLAAPAAAQELTLEDVLNGYYEAIGGLDAWKSVESIRMTGKMAMGPGMEAPFVMMEKRPGKLRIEFTFQGMTGVQAYDGESAWIVMPFLGKTEPEAAPAEMAKQLEEQADVDGPLIGWEEEGHQLELLGVEEVEGTKAYKLKLTRASGDVEYYYLDAEYYVPIKVEGSREMRGQTVKFETTLSDYKEVDGLLLPHAIESRQQGAQAGQVITIEKVELNVDIPDSVFVMPKTAGAGQQK
jgi:outer membrane lipoprotein-sorting protein